MNSIDQTLADVNKIQKIAHRPATKRFPAEYRAEFADNPGQWVDIPAETGERVSTLLSQIVFSIKRIGYTVSPTRDADTRNAKWCTERIQHHRISEDEIAHAADYLIVAKGWC